jgi:hypothetical protein
MWYSATINAYDVLGDVWITVVVREAVPGPTDERTTLFQRHVQFQGTGESRPEVWLQDALVALAETL